MPIIHLRTIIKARKEIVFDLSRSIDLHKISTAHTNEEAIAGKTSGLIEMGESVTWKARHFGVYQTLTSKITSLDKPNSFVDEMVKGIFVSFKHQHIFEDDEGQTLMTDIFEYKSPFGLLGKMVNSLFLKTYMANLLKTRNSIIKEFAESGKWKQVVIDASVSEESNRAR